MDYTAALVQIQSKLDTITNILIVLVFVVGFVAGSFLAKHFSFWKW